MLVQLARTRPRGVEVTDGEEHRDGAREHPGARHGRPRLHEEPPHRSEGRGLRSPRQPQQGRARLRVEAVLGARRVGGVRPGRLAAQPVEVAELARGQTDRREGPGQPVALDGRRQLLHGLVPRPAGPHHLAAVQGALAGEGDEPGLLLAPALQQLGPLLDAAQVRHLLAALDGGAVDVAEQDRLEGAVGRLEHRLVEERDAGGDPAAVDRHPPLGAEPDGEQAGVTVPASRLGRPLGAVEGSDEVPLTEVGEHPGEGRGIRPRGCRPGARRRAVHHGEPARRGRVVAPHPQDHREVERAAGCARSGRRPRAALRTHAGSGRPRRRGGRAAGPPSRRTRGRSPSGRQGRRTTTARGRRPILRARTRLSRGPARRRRPRHPPPSQGTPVTAAATCGRWPHVASRRVGGGHTWPFDGSVGEVEGDVDDG